MNNCAKTYPIAFASDDKGITLLGISLYSLLISKNPNTKYKIYILEDNISTDNHKKIKSLEDTFDCELHFIPVHYLLEQHIFQSSRQWPAATYARCFLPSLLPHENSVLYVDIDTIFLQDIGDVFHLNMGDFLLAAVYEPDDDNSREKKTRLTIPKKYGYFNAGVLLFNLKSMRKNGTETALLDYIHQHETDLLFLDQDTLNAVLYDKTAALSPQWNWPQSMTRKLLSRRHRNPKNRWGNVPTKMMFEAAYSPYIIHFMGIEKPIQYNYGYYGRLYRKIWLQSPWNNIPITGNKRFKYQIRRICYLPFDWLVRVKIWFQDSTSHFTL